MAISNSSLRCVEQLIERRRDTWHDPAKAGQETPPPGFDTEEILRKRVKELKCLCEISRLVEKHRDSEEAILQGIADLLPPSWLYPASCCARLVVNGREYRSPNYRRSSWFQSAPIKSGARIVGAVEIFYTEEKPELDEGPFLKEERDLLDVVAERVGGILDRLSAEHRFEMDRATLKERLKESNGALKQILGQIEEEKAEIRAAVRANVEKILMPTLRSLSTEIPTPLRRYVTLLQDQLNELASPFASTISKSFGSLTPAEIEIFDMIRGGMSTKEIASLRHVSPATVSKQRERIRRKLKIAGTDANLTTHLIMLASENGDTPSQGMLDSAIVY